MGIPTVSLQGFSNSFGDYKFSPKHPVDNKNLLAEHRNSSEKVELHHSNPLQSQQLYEMINNNRISEALELLKKGASPDDKCYQEALQKRQLELAKEMLSTGFLPSSSLQISLVDPSKRAFAKAWLEYISAPELRFLQALHFKDHDFIKPAYDHLMECTSQIFLEKRDNYDKSFALEKLMLKYPMLSRNKQIFADCWAIACRENLKLVQLLVAMGLSPSTLDQEGNHGLHIAVGNLKADIVGYLISLNKIDVNQKNSRQETALQIFVRDNKNNIFLDDKIMLDLLQAGAQMKEEEDAKWIWQRVSGNKKSLKMLIEKNPDLVCWGICQTGTSYGFKEFRKEYPNFCFSNDQLTMIWGSACCNRDVRIIKSLVESKIFENFKLNDSDGNNGLHLAAKSFAKETLEYLLDKMDVNEKNKYLLTPLQELCKSSDCAPIETKISMAFSLLKKDAKLNWQETKIIFQWCCEKDDVNHVKQFIEMNITMHENKGDNSFVHIAAQALAKNTMSYLLEIRKWNLSLLNEQSKTPLTLLCHLFTNENKEIVLQMIRALLKAHASPNIQTDENLTLLVALFKKIWSEHVVQISKQAPTGVNWGGSNSLYKSLCTQYWVANYHDLAKTVITLFHEYGADLEPLIHYFEKTYWEETIHKFSPFVLPVTVETRQHIGSHLDLVTKTTIHPGTPVANPALKKHALKDVAKVTYKFLKGKQKEKRKYLFKDQENKNKVIYF